MAAGWMVAGLDVPVGSAAICRRLLGAAGFSVSDLARILPGLLDRFRRPADNGNAQVSGAFEQYGFKTREGFVLRVSFLLQ